MILDDCLLDMASGYATPNLIRTNLRVLRNHCTSCNGRTIADRDTGKNDGSQAYRHVIAQGYRIELVGSTLKRVTGQNGVKADLRIGSDADQRRVQNQS